MSLQRTATTRKPPSGPARRRKDYDIVQQGIKELYPLDKQNVEPEIDIVFVPGLGANPEDSWKSESTGFNWTTDGLVRDFPRARILLYMYESAWTGSLKVKQFMSNIAMTLLNGLKSKREDRIQRRPIVFIGHSMGGLVIAKAITIADSRRDKFPVMFEAIAAAIFFGTPFNGAAAASAAAMYAYYAEKIGAASSSKLLDLMKPGDEGLRELKHEFMRLVGKLNPKIELLCFYEEQPTDFSKMAGLPSLFGLSKLAIPKSYADFVTRDSATLPGVEEQGLAANHRDLVKFDGPKDDMWSQFVKDPMKKIIHGAQLAVKNRLNSVRDIDRSMINGIMEVLDGAQVSKKRRTLAQTFAPSSWITKEAEYKEWLYDPDNYDDGRVFRNVECLWIRGPEGRGKTSASLAAIDEIERIREKDTSEGPVLLAYFFCDPATDYSTAEDLLKSLITQLINQQEMLASYAKSFAKKKGEESLSRARVTVENLWQTLQDMLNDDFIGSKVIFVLNNLHVLPEDWDSTIKLMNYLKKDLQTDTNGFDSKRVTTRWMITSREAHNIGEALKVEGVRLVDLEDEKYGDQVQTALRKRAKERITTLEKEKNYNKALAYFASSLIGKRAQNTQWIDITCIQLQELPQAESDLTVRRVLENMPQDLTMLLNNAWLQIFKTNEADVEKIKEMLRALVLTYEDPTEAELCVLAGFSSSDEEKAELLKFVEKCKPLLVIKRTSYTISFMNVVVKTHLLENANQLLGMSSEEKKWQHGVLALRSFSHVNESFDFPITEKPEEAENEENNDEDGEGSQDEGSDNEEEEEEDDDDESEDSGSEWSSEDSSAEQDPEADILYDKALPYTVKYWLRHASKATREIAEDLSLEESFWKPDSIIRHRWLVEHCRMTNVFENYDYKTMTGLHIAASIGFRELVAALIRNGYQDQIKIYDSLFNTPLHLAAGFGRPKIVEELLNKGAEIDDGIDAQDQTALHMAAFDGHVEVMKKLLLRGANPNAIANDIGPVVNAAISSGNRACVELLVERGVSLTVEREDLQPPLAHAASLSDISMFGYLVEKYADKLPAEEYSKAFVKAAEAGRVEVFNKLLEFEHSQEYFQKALEAAIDDWNWDIVSILLEKRTGLNCDNVFYEAATCSEPQDEFLEEIWKYTGGSISREMLNKTLYDATDREKESTVELLLKKFGADPNATGEEYGNALTAAAYDGTMNIVRLLLDAGANVNAPEGWAIQTAATEGHYDVVEELLKRGADVNACTENPNFECGTAIQGACEWGKTDIVALLLEHGADPNLGSGSDKPPIVAAAMRAEEEIVELLVKAKAKLDVVGESDPSGTPLTGAAAYMPQSSLQLMLDAGADINLADNDGDTPLIVAASRGDEEAVLFLLNSGADIMHSNKRSLNAIQTAFEHENHECLKVLIDRVSILLRDLKSSMDSGNAEVTSVVRSAFSKPQELNYDDESPPTPRFPSGAETPRYHSENEHDSGSDGGESTTSDDHHEDNTKGSQHGGNEGTFFDSHSTEEQPRETDTFDFAQMSEQLKTALANQAEMWNKFTDKSPAEAPAGAEESDYQSGAQEKREEAYQPAAQTSTEAYQQPVPQTVKQASPQTGIGQWTEQITQGLSEPISHAVELPSQDYVKRKPAPVMPYESKSQYNHTPSPQPSESSTGRFQAPSAPVSQGPTIAPYRPDDSAPQSSAPYQNTHSYQQSQSSIPTTQPQSSSHYQSNSIGYSGSAPYQAPATQYPTQQPAFTPYNPDSYAQSQQQQPSSTATAYQGPAYKPQEWQQQQHQGYYASASGPQQQQYSGLDWEQTPPPLKTQRSSFFSGGVKNTFDKAKFMGNGMFGRK
ncbi:uncharacterized protein GGS22DRAFT_168217 [Annulohypoxylon maeteangense]|uniref:uncharacterized protein n=1 Tax=Annulohypoxylon maeteangense TaxID=1927788 RepID=UPI002007934E|nr:uncharacterized protein GGS22DRAFT_168217 [Annulohypoxylon maeteangense]KAI0883239.1 hypothetical protein GGS22DRAFT_168217 [Annulohypoxylon maeteangense]